MARNNCRFMTTPMLMNAATQAERHAFDKTVDIDWLKYRVAANGFHLATIVTAHNRTDRIVLPHHRVEILMKQSRGADSTMFHLDIAIDAWEMLIPVSELNKVRQEILAYQHQQTFPSAFPSSGAVEQ
jgi:hypothetical protein